MVAQHILLSFAGEPSSVPFLSRTGAYVIELLKDEYPSACILSHCIWPFESGEVIVQNYNALLTLAKLQESADGIIISQNESLSSICRKTLGIPRPSFDDMNDVVAHSLASIFLPASWRSVDPSEAHRKTASRDGASHDKDDSYTKAGIHGAGTPVRLLSDLVSKLCAHPGYRMLSLRFTPQACPLTHHYHLLPKISLHVNISQGREHIPMVFSCFEWFPSLERFLFFGACFVDFVTIFERVSIH